MAFKSTEISQDIYHRIYRLYKKNIEPNVIATTVNLPLKTVHNIVGRFAHTYHPSAVKNSEAASFLDILVMARGRYAVIELTGCLTAEQQEILEVEFNKAVVLPYKAFALRMTDVMALDKKGTETVLAFAEKCRDKGIYVAILDPALAIEPVICEHELDAKVPVFGTETVFEKNAFAGTVERHHKK
jgi:hypothetical protein